MIFLAALGAVITGLIMAALVSLLYGLILMLGVSVVHDLWLSSVPTIGYWAAVVVAFTIRALFTDTRASSS